MLTHRLLSLAVLTAALALPASADAAPKLLLDATTVLDAPLAAGAGEAAGASTAPTGRTRPASRPATCG